MRKLSYYQDFTKEAIDEYSERNELRDEIEKLATADYELPAEITEVVAGIRTVKSTDAGDAVTAGRKVIAGANVKIEVIPPAPASGMNGQLASDIDTALTWHWNMMNRRGVNPPLARLAESAIMFSAVAFQVEKLSRKFREETGNRKRAILRGCDYALVFHDVRDVFPEVSPYLSPERVVLRQNTTLADAINKYGREVCAKLIEDKDKNITQKKQDVTLYDYQDYEERAIFAGLGANADPGGCGVMLLQEENNLPFLNWVYREFGHPLLELLADSGENDVYNIIQSLKLYEAIALAGQPRKWTETTDGRDVEIDYSDIGGKMSVRTGEAVHDMPPAQGDSKTENEIQRYKAKIAQTTQISQALTALDQFSGNAFSTINAMREVGVASLSDPMKIVKFALEDMFYLMLEWQKFDKKPLHGYVAETTDKLEPMLTAGAQVDVDMSKIEPSDFIISVSLTPDPSVDKQGRMNQAQLAGQVLHLDHKKQWEIAGIEGAEQSHMDWKDEQVQLAEVIATAEARKILITGAAQLEIEKTKMQMQLEFQQQMAQQQPQPQAQPQPGRFPAAQGVDQRAGGSSAMQSNPQATREAMTGRDQRGAEVA